MKQLLIKILLTLSVFLLSFTNIIPNTYADGGITVIVSEKVPGANCTNINPDGSSVTQGGVPMYKCTVQKGFGSAIDMLGEIIKYFTFLAALTGVLFIVINGILYSMGGLDDSLKTKSKERITTTLIGLILLFLSGVILNMIAPWIYK